MTFLSPFWTSQKFVKLVKTQIYFWTCYEQKIKFYSNLIFDLTMTFLGFSFVLMAWM